MLWSTASGGRLNRIKLKQSVCNTLTPGVLPLLGVSHHPDLGSGAGHVGPPQPDVVAVAEENIEHEDGDRQDDGAHPDVFLL